MLKQGLELKQTQKLSPLQIQTIKLIELPVQELEQRIRKELEENPVLDEDVSKESEDGEAPREVSLSEYKEDDAIPSYRLRSDIHTDKNERPQYNTFSVKESFTQSLQEPTGSADPAGPAVQRHLSDFPKAVFPVAIAAFPTPLHVGIAYFAKAAGQCKRELPTKLR